MKYAEKKLQVFISSTFIDLKKERQKCVESILNAGHIPAGMELFKAGDKTQKQIITEWIKDSDVYLLILGGRYGSIDPELGISYTQWEYQLASELGIPRFSIVLDDEYIKKQVVDKTLDPLILEMNNPQYIEFKKLVMTKMVSNIKSLESIKGEVLGSILEIQKNYPDLDGWVKASSKCITEKEYTVSISARKDKIDDDYENAITKLFELNRYLYPSSKSTPTRPVQRKSTNFDYTISFVIKAPSLYFAERRRKQFEEIVKDYDWFMFCDLEEFKGFKKLSTTK